MPKSNRKKKADRAKAAGKRAQQDRRRAAITAEEAARERRDRLWDPATPVAELRVLAAEEYGQTPFAGGSARMMLRNGFSLETLTTVAEYLLEDQPQGLGALMFAAAIAHEKGDERGEHELIEQALALAETQDQADAEDPSSVWWTEVVRELSANGHPGKAIELLEPYLREHPDDDNAVEIYGTAIEHAFEECDTDGDRAAVARFADRSAFVELEEAVTAWVEAHPEWAAAVEQVVGERRKGAESGHDRTALEAFRLEGALWGATLNDDDSATLLNVFAADSGVTPDLRARAETWADRGHYGLWQIGDITPSPGVWATDLVTGVHLYLEAPASVLADMGPWGVWLGAALPVDGIWRLTGTGMRLTPAEGDAAAEYADEAAMVIMRATAGLPVSPSSPPWLRIGEAEPFGARWDYEEPAGPDLVRLTSKVVSVVAADIVAQVTAHRANPSLLRNEDDEPMLFIEARVAVGPDARDRLLSHPEFEAEGETIHWWGTGASPDASRATLTVEGEGALRVSVNSGERMERLLRRLRTLGLDPVVIWQAGTDPDQGFAWPSPGLPEAGPSAEDWVDAWLNVQVPDLGRKTLREAASGSLEDRIMVESLLRRFEHDAYLREVAGHKTVDVRSLRAELGLSRE